MLAMANKPNHTDNMARTKRDDAAVTLAWDVVKMARRQAVDHGTRWHGTLTDRLHPFVQRDFDALRAKMAQQANPEKGQK